MIIHTLESDMGTRKNKKWGGLSGCVLSMYYRITTYKTVTQKFGIDSLSQLGRVLYVVLVLLRMSCSGLAMANVTPSTTDGPRSLGGAGLAAPIPVSAFFHAYSSDEEARRDAAASGFNPVSAADPDAPSVCFSLDFAGLFDSDGVHLNRRWWGSLTHLSQMLIKSPETRLRVYSADVGGDELVARRMSSIRGFLVEHGVNPIRIPESPVGPSDGLSRLCPVTRAVAGR